MKKNNTLLKASLFLLSFGISSSVLAQQWSPSSSFTDQSVIYRMGKVGIGTSTPGSKLEIASDEVAPLIFNRLNSSTSKNEIVFRQLGVNKWAIGHDANSNNGNNFFIHDSNDGISRIFIDGTSGGVGINKTIIPASADLATNRLILGEPNGTHSGFIQVNGSGGWGYNIMSRAINNNNNPTKLFAGIDVSASGDKEVFTVLSNGQTKIGYKSPSYHLDAMLAVDGKIVSKAINVTAGPWADYVFEKDYKLVPLSEVEIFIKENKHLPEIPSAAEVEEKGIDVATMDALLLKKIEELTLHLIELEKQNKNLSNRIKGLETK